MPLLTALLSFRMVGVAGRLLLRYPASLLVAFASLVFIGAVVGLPAWWVLQRAHGDPLVAWAVFNDAFLFHYVSDPYFAGNYAGAAAAFAAWSAAAYALWVLVVTFGTLVTSTIIMHTGVMQLRGQKPSLREAAGLAKRNLLRLLGLAVLTGVVAGLSRYTAVVLRRLPLMRWAPRVSRAAMTGALYVLLPIVVYERRGLLGALRETQRHVESTWGGLAAGTGFLLGSTWGFTGLTSYAYFLLQGQVLGSLGAGNLGIGGLASAPPGFNPLAVDWLTIIALQLVVGILLYCISLALGANLRAALYVQVTEQKQVLPEGAIVGAPEPSLPAGLGVGPWG
jgi:hypothetical protein